MHKSRGSVRSVLAALACSTLLAGILIGAAQSPASATVTQVRGSACGYQTNVGLFGGPQGLKGCGTAVPSTDPSYSPAVTLPSGGSANAITGNDPDGSGSKAQYGPAVIFGGIWPADVRDPTPSGPITVSTQGTPGGGTVTSTADIALNPTPKPVTCYADASMTCQDPGGFGPPPVWGDHLHAECSASETGVTGSATFENSFAAKAMIVGGADDGAPDPAATEPIPANPPVNYTLSGVISNVGDRWTTVFNEHIVNADGSLTVNAVHMFLFGQIAVGENIRGSVTCGTTPSAIAATDTTAPTCGVPWVASSELLNPTSPPKEPRTEMLGLFDTGGLQSISNVQTSNATLQYGNPNGFDADPATTPAYLRFVPGQTGPFVMVARQVDREQIMTWSFDAIDVAGNTTHCSGVGDTPPVAVDDSYSMPDLATLPFTVDAAHGVLANDVDPEVAAHVYGNTLSAHRTPNFDNDPEYNPFTSPPPAASITTANGGLVSLDQVTGAFYYSPPAKFGGVDNFTYAVRDGAGGSSTGTVTISVPSVPSLTVADISVNEGDSGTTPATFTVTRSGDLSKASTVKYKTSGGTAKAPDDYAAVPLQTLTFDVGVSSQQVTVAVTGDTFPEPNETVMLVLSGPTNAALADASATATIVNDDGPAYLSVGDIAVPEGNSGTTPATFTITRSGNTSGTSTVKYKTGAGTATAGTDYTAVALSATPLTFGPGDTSKTVSVDVLGDTADENNETLSLVLSAPVGATLSDASGTATIVDDDPSGVTTPPPSTFLSVNDVSVNEGNPDTNPANQAVFTITRSGNTSGTSTVKYMTKTGSAGTGDFTAVALTQVTFDPGQDSKTVSVPITGDTIAEANEVFTLSLSSPTGAVISDGGGAATIVNDDAPAFLSVNDVAVTEGNSGTTPGAFTVTRSGNLTGTSTVTYTFKTATAGAGDFTASPSTASLTFDPGQTTKTVGFSVVGDTVHEANETFTLALSSPVGATISDAAGVATIGNDDASPLLLVHDSSVAEGDTGTTVLTFTVTRSGDTSGTSKVTYKTFSLANGDSQWATTSGSFPGAVDYAPIASTVLTFNPGETTKTVDVTVYGDKVEEYNYPGEKFALQFSAVSGARMDDWSANGFIIDEPTDCVNGEC